MGIKEDRNKAIIDEFHRLLRSGSDYAVRHMYLDAGKIAYAGPKLAEKIVNKWYDNFITEEMISYYNSLDGKNNQKICSMSSEYNLCRRESILVIRYIKVHNINRCKAKTK